MVAVSSDLTLPHRSTMMRERHPSQPKRFERRSRANESGCSFWALATATLRGVRPALIVVIHARNQPSS
jgi:hypothetical protein